MTATRRHSLSSNPRRIANNPIPNLDLWPFIPKTTAVRIYQGHSLYQVWTLCDHSYLVTLRMIVWEIHLLTLWPWPLTFQPQNHNTCRISQGHSLFQVWARWNLSFLSYATDKQTNWRTRLSYAHRPSELAWVIIKVAVTQARFPFKRNRLRCVCCVNENRKKRKRLRWQAANHGCHCFDRAFLLAGACVCCVKISRNKGFNTAGRKRRQQQRTELGGDMYPV